MLELGSAPAFQEMSFKNVSYMESNNTIKAARSSMNLQASSSEAVKPPKRPEYRLEAKRT